MKFPLLFGYRDLIAGNGYIAGVATDGRFLLDEDEDEYCVYGVNPGGIAGTGTDRHEALQDFRLGYRSVLHDIAENAANFSDFRAEVKRFFSEHGKRSNPEIQIGHV